MNKVSEDYSLCSQTDDARETLHRAAPSRYCATCGGDETVEFKYSPLHCSSWIRCSPRKRLEKKIILPKISVLKAEIRCRLAASVWIVTKSSPAMKIFWQGMFDGLVTLPVHDPQKNTKNRT